MKWLKSVIIFFSYVAITSNAANAEDIVFGYSTDSAPISYNDGSGKIAGFCGNLLDFLEEKNSGSIRKKIKMESPDERFKAFASKLERGQVGIQCSANSITLDRKDNYLINNSSRDGFYGEFSVPFFIAKTRLLIRKDKAHYLYKNPNDLKIGVLKDTTTNSALRSFFPTNQFISVDSRDSALTKLVKGDIDAYASDDVLLLDILAHNLKDKADDYVIEPNLYGYSREEYAIVIYYTNRPDDYGHSKLKQEIDEWLSQNGSGSVSMNKVLEERNIDTSLPLLMDYSLDASLQKNNLMTTLLLKSTVAENWSVVRLVFYAIFLLAILSLFFLFWYFFKIKSYLKILQEKEAILIESEKSGKSTQKEFLEAGDILHNQAISSIARVKDSLSDTISFLEEDSLPVPESLYEAKNHIEDAITHVRDASYRIHRAINKPSRNPKLEKIEDILKKYRNKFDISDDINIESFNIDDDVINNACEILYICLENIKNHANVNTAFVNIDIKNDKNYEFLSIEVRDMGVGFDSQKNALGVGLSSIKRKMEGIGGAVRIRSKPNQGTTIEASIPLKGRKH